MTFNVEISETSSVTVEIEAKDKDEAIQKVKDKWRNADYVIGAEDFDEVEFKIVEED